jgi:beta-glucosidase
VWPVGAVDLHPLRIGRRCDMGSRPRRRLGALLGQEALERGCRVLLAPTVNLHRSPLAGRNFECYSEDPLLSGRLAAGFVRGVQSCGVVATVKHLVGNEAEFERGTISSVIDERSLRELYLLPFELAVRDGGALAIMTSYNRLNGRWLTQQREILVDVLRGEWGFDGPLPRRGPDPVTPGAVDAVAANASRVVDEAA